MSHNHVIDHRRRLANLQPTLKAGLTRYEDSLQSVVPSLSSLSSLALRTKYRSLGFNTGGQTNAIRELGQDLQRLLDILLGRPQEEVPRTTVEQRHQPETDPCDREPPKWGSIPNTCMGHSSFVTPKMVRSSAEPDVAQSSERCTAIDSWYISTVIPGGKFVPVDGLGCGPNVSLNLSSWSGCLAGSVATT